MAQELVTVKNQLKSAVQIVGSELTRIDEQVQLLDLESQKVQESFATRVAERLGETDERQTRHEVVTSQLHEAVQGTGEQSTVKTRIIEPCAMSLELPPRVRSGVFCFFYGPQRG